jgi:hypothetical protein
MRCCGACSSAARPAPDRAGGADRRQNAGSTNAKPNGAAMSYVLLIIEPPEQRAQRGLKAGQAAYAQMLDFAEGLKQRGVLVAVESLASSAKGTRVQVRDGRASLLDGPFAEAKEMIGGFFLLADGTTREEALAIAAQCPAAQWCSVEVRELGPCWA